MSNQYPVNQSGFQPNTYQNQSVYGNTGLSNTELVFKDNLYLSLY